MASCTARKHTNHSLSRLTNRQLQRAGLPNYLLLMRQGTNKTKGPAINQSSTMLQQPPTICTETPTASTKRGGSQLRSNKTSQQSTRQRALCC